MSSSGESSRSSAGGTAPGSAGFGVHVDEAVGVGCGAGVAGEVDVATAGLIGDGLWLASEMPVIGWSLTFQA